MAASDTPTSPPQAPPRGAGPVTAVADPSRAPTTALMRAVRVVVGPDRRLAALPDPPGSAWELMQIQGEQAGGALRQARARYHAVDLAGRELGNAIVQAVRWADELAALTGAAHLVDTVTHATLTAGLARRLLVDGRDIAERTVAACRDAVTDQCPLVPAPRTAPSPPVADHHPRPAGRP